MARYRSPVYTYMPYPPAGGKIPRNFGPSPGPPAGSEYPPELTKNINNSIKIHICRFQQAFTVYVTSQLGN